MRSQLKEKEEICENLESKVVWLRKELENPNSQLHKILKSIETLNEILSYQRLPFIKTSLGYYEIQKTPEEDTSKENEENPTSYANVLKGYIYNESNNMRENDDQHKHEFSI